MIVGVKVEHSIIVGQSLVILPKLGIKLRSPNYSDTVVRVELYGLGVLSQGILRLSCRHPDCLVQVLLRLLPKVVGSVVVINQLFHRLYDVGDLGFLGS